MTEQTFNGGDDELTDQQGLPGEVGTPEEEAGPSELDPDTAADYAGGLNPSV